MNYKSEIKKTGNKGYTIIETMIAVSIFIIIVMIGMGALLNANALHNKSRDMRSIMDSLSFAIEDLSRNLRTGSNYHCLLPNQGVLPTTPRSCASGPGIAFEAEGGTPGDSSDQWVYAVSSTLNPDGTNTTKLFKSTKGLAAATANWVQLTPPEVVLNPDAFFITVVGALPPPGDTLEPFVTIRLGGTITYKGIVTPFSLQTSVSQRSIDI